MSGGGCRETRELLAAFLDDELPVDRSHAIQAHLEICPPCLGFSRLEQTFTREIRARLRWVEPPDGLLERVQGRLAEPPEAVFAPKGAQSSWRRTIGLVAAAVVFLSALAVPVVRLYAPGVYDAARREVTGERIESATLVCFECDREGIPMEAQRRCHAPGHQTGLRCPKSGLWHLVANDTTLPLMSDRERRGEKVSVEGRWLDDIHYVDARRVLPPGT
jgi:hypothetical protein